MIFFAILTVGFVLEIGSGALYFTNQKSSVIELRPQAETLENKLHSQPLFQCCLLGVAAISAIDCFSLNEWLETLSSLSLDGDLALSCVFISGATFRVNHEMIGFRFINQKSGSTGQKPESSSQTYLKEIRELYKGLPTSNIYLLAKRHITSGAPTDANVTNQYLSEFFLSITQEELDILISINKVEFELPLDKTSDLLLEVIGRSLNKSHPDSTTNRFVGVYVLTNKITFVAPSLEGGKKAVNLTFF
jgi:hypothetical protein